VAGDIAANFLNCYCGQTTCHHCAWEYHFIQEYCYYIYPWVSEWLVLWIFCR